MPELPDAALDPFLERGLHCILHQQGLIGFEVADDLIDAPLDTFQLLAPHLKSLLQERSLADPRQFGFDAGLGLGQSVQSEGFGTILRVRHNTPSGLLTRSAI